MMPVLTLIGHRGTPSEHTENTLASLAHAQALGADAVEFDVRLTRDGVPVLLHDADLVRIWNRPERLGELDYSDVAGFLPSLAEVVDALSIDLVVDCKGAGTVQQAIRVLRRSGALARSVFIGEHEILGDVRAELPGARIALSWRGGSTPAAAVLDAVRPTIMNLRWSDLDEAHLEWYAAAGLGSWWTYTVDDEQALDRAVSLGIAGVITNNLSALAAARPSAGAA